MPGMTTTFTLSSTWSAARSNVTDRPSSATTPVAAWLQSATGCVFHVCAPPGFHAAAPAWQATITGGEGACVPPGETASVNTGDPSSSATVNRTAATAVGPLGAPCTIS